MPDSPEVNDKHPPAIRSSVSVREQQLPDGSLLAGPPSSRALRGFPGFPGLPEASLGFLGLPQASRRLPGASLGFPGGFPEIPWASLEASRASLRGFPGLPWASWASLRGFPRLPGLPGLPCPTTLPGTLPYYPAQTTLPYYPAQTTLPYYPARYPACSLGSLRKPRKPGKPGKPGYKPATREVPGRDVGFPRTDGQDAVRGKLEGSRVPDSGRAQRDSGLSGTSPVQCPDGTLAVRPGIYLLLAPPSSPSRGFSWLPGFPGPP